MNYVIVTPAWMVEPEDVKREIRIVRTMYPPDYDQTGSETDTDDSECAKADDSECAKADTVSVSVVNSDVDSDAGSEEAKEIQKPGVDDCEEVIDIPSDEELMEMLANSDDEDDTKQIQDDESDASAEQQSGEEEEGEEEKEEGEEGEVSDEEEPQDDLTDTRDWRAESEPTSPVHRRDRSRTPPQHRRTPSPRPRRRIPSPPGAPRRPRHYRPRNVRRDSSPIPYARPAKRRRDEYDNVDQHAFNQAIGDYNRQAQIRRPHFAPAQRPRFHPQTHPLASTGAPVVRIWDPMRIDLEQQEALACICSMDREIVVGTNIDVKMCYAWPELDCTPCIGDVHLLHSRFGNLPPMYMVVALNNDGTQELQQLQYALNSLVKVLREDGNKEVAMRQMPPYLLNDTTLEVRMLYAVFEKEIRLNYLAESRHYMHAFVTDLKTLRRPAARRRLF